jgi:hypothetical protein
MPTILDQYLNRARASLGSDASDRALGAALGLSTSAISHMRCERNFPDDLTMMRLAELAGADPAAALIELNAWRARSHRVREVYEKIRASLGALVLAVLLELVAFTTVFARENDSGADSVAAVSLYYQKCRRRLAAARSKFFSRSRYA